MSGADLMGWVAAAVTLMTFACQDMRCLRWLAVCANVAFIAYGAGADLMPVLALHLALVPVNLWRLWQLGTGARRTPARAHPVPSRRMDVCLPLAPQRDARRAAREGWNPR